jgi:PmbA protein
MRAEEICQLVLRACKAQGVNDVVVSVGQSEGVMLRFSNDQITVANTLMDVTANIFVNDNGRKASTSVADLTKKGLEFASRKVVEAAKHAPAGATYAPLPKGPFTYDRKLLEGRTVPSDPKKLVSYVQDAILAAKAEGAKRVAGSLIVDNGKLTLHTSSGAFGMLKKSSMELSLRAFASDVASGHAVCVAGIESDFKPAETGAEAGRMARLASEPVEGEPGEYKAVLGPMVFADIVQQAGRHASAFFVDANLSFLSDKLGQRVAAESFNLVDDPTLENSYGSVPFDAEGLPTQRTPIVENGILRTYLHNSSTALKFGSKSTANAGLVAPHPFNLVVGAGESTLEELIAAVDKGIYVTNDWYLRYQNYQTGDFSAIPRDAMFLIKDGKIDRPIKELRISDNVLRMLSNLRGMTRERRWIKWWEVEVPVLCPAALVDGVRFTKSRQ